MPDYSAFPEDIQDDLESFSNEIDELMRQLEQGEITLDQWRDLFAGLLASYVVAAFLIGSGLADIAGEANTWLTNWLAVQLDYLNNFKDAIRANRETGSNWSPGFDARARMYAASMIAPYWYGETFGLPLPAMPGDMSSECGVLDACGWEIDWLDREQGDADCYWRLDVQRIVREHCQQCLERARQWNPLKVRGWRLVLPEVTKGLHA